MLCDVMSFHVSPVLLCTTKYYAVLQSTTPVLQSTTPKYYPGYRVVLEYCSRYYSTTTLHYKVLVQYYSVLQTPYYKVLLQYYSVLQSTTPVLLPTTKHHSSTTLYYKVLVQYYSVLQSTTLVITTPYYKVLLQYNSVLEK